MPRSRTATPERELDTATADVDELQRQVAEAEERAARARAVIAERHEQAMQRRAEAQYAYDERLLEEYRATDRALVTAEQEARQRFLDALVADPVWGALVEMYAAQTRRRHRQFEASQAAGRLGRREPGTVPHVDVSFEQMVTRTIEQAAGQVAAEETAQREAEREAVGERAAAEG